MWPKNPSFLNFSNCIFIFYSPDELSKNASLCLVFLTIEKDINIYCVNSLYRMYMYTYPLLDVLNPDIQNTIKVTRSRILSDVFCLFSEKYVTTAHGLVKVIIFQIHKYRHSSNKWLYRNLKRNSFDKITITRSLDVDLLHIRWENKPSV